MKIVIIANTIFPHNQPRAFRATELAKEFAERNHEVVLISNLGNYDYEEFTAKHPIKIKNLGPNLFYKQVSNGEWKYNFVTKVLSKLFYKRILFPEIELAYRTYQALIKEKNVDLLITLAPSHAIHWGAAFFKSRFPNKFSGVWIADCGDPFSGNQSAKYAKYLKRVENWAFKFANYITVPTDDSISGYSSVHHHKIRVIPQGFKFTKNDIKSIEPNEVPYFVYGGIFYKEIRDPRPFLDYILSLDIDFLFRIYTNKDSFIKDYIGIDKRLDIVDFVSREQFLEQLEKADFAVNFANKGSVQTPSKLIDYAIKGTPILQANFGIVDQKLILEFLEGNYSNGYKITDIDQYKIENVVNKFLSTAFE